MKEWTGIFLIEQEIWRQVVPRLVWKCVMPSGSQALFSLSLRWAQSAGRSFLMLSRWWSLLQTPCPSPTSCQNRSSSLPSQVDYQWEGLLCAGHDWVRHPCVNQFLANRINDCFQMAVMIPLLGLHTLPPGAEQNRYCKNHLENKGMGKDHPQQVSMRDRWGSPWTMAQRCHLQLLKPKARGAGVLLWSSRDVGDRAAAMVCPRMQPLHRPSPTVPRTATQPTQWEQSTPHCFISPEFFQKRRPPLHFPVFPKTWENEINYFGLKDFKFLRKADLLTKNLTPCFFF